MESTSDRKIVLVTRKTRIDDLISRFNTEGQARFYIEHLGDDYEDYQREHETYRQSVAACVKLLPRWGRVHQIDREFLPNYTFGADDVVVVLGQDGLVANTIKYLDGHPVVGVNPDPKRWDGVLLPFAVPDLKSIMRFVVEDSRACREISMAKVKLNTGEEMHAVNDFFIGPKSHTSARYIITAGGISEEQSSSGVIVSTGVGSTGWHRSLMTGAAGVASKITGRPIDVESPEPFTWESDFLRFTVREPFPSVTSTTSIITGRVDERRPLRLVSRMAGQGVIFSDGIEADYLEFNSGTEAIVTVAEKKGRMIQ